MWGFFRAYDGLWSLINHQHSAKYLVGGLVAIFYFPIYWVFIFNGWRQLTTCPLMSHWIVLAGFLHGTVCETTPIGVALFKQRCASIWFKNASPTKCAFSTTAFLRSWRSMAWPCTNRKLRRLISLRMSSPAATVHWSFPQPNSCGLIHCVFMVLVLWKVIMLLRKFVKDVCERFLQRSG